MTTSNLKNQRSARTARVLSAALCLLCGCPEDDFGASTLLAPVALETQLLLPDTAHDRAIMLGVSSSNMNQRRVVPVPHGTIAAFRRNGHDEALVLSVGRRAEQDKKAEPAVLSAIDAAGRLRRYELGNPFDSLVQSDDGTYVFLFKAGASMRLLDNPNEIAIVNLDAADPTGAVNLRTLRSFGDSPATVVFSPTMQIVNEDRRLAVVLSPTNVTLLDLSHLDRRETTVQLSSSAGKAVQPRAVIFNPTQPELYVRADSNDMFVFNLRERRADEAPSNDGEQHNDFRPFIDQLGIGGVPSAMETYTVDGQTRVLVVAQTATQAFSVDPSTSQVAHVDLLTPANQVLLFEAGSPRDHERSMRALVYQPGFPSVQFIDLADLAARGSRNVEQLQLELPVDSVLPMLDQGQVMVLHKGNGVSLIDLEARTITLISSNARLVDARFDATRRTLWFGPESQPFVGLLDLETGATSEILLDSNVKQLVPVFGARHVAVIHESDEGEISLIDADQPVRERTATLTGFLKK